MDIKQKTIVECRLSPRFHCGLTLDDIRAMRQAYVWRSATVDDAQCHFGLYTRSDRNYGFQAPGYWRHVWVGANASPWFNPGYNDLDLYRLLVDPRGDKLIGRRDSRQMVTHEFGKVPVDAWRGPTTEPITFVSPHGIHRVLLPGPFAGDRRLWIMPVRMGMGAANWYHMLNDDRPMTQAEVRNTVRTHGWLTLIHGARALTPEDTVESFSLTRV